MLCAVLTGGVVSDLAWLAEVLKKVDRLICVDKGANYAAALDLAPHLLIGDMDSVSPSVLERFHRQRVTIREYPRDKDTTDTALGLAEALLDQPDEIIILGATGARFDHTLANVHLLRIALEKKVAAKIMDEYNELSLIAPEKPGVVEGHIGTEFSLLPLTEMVSGVCVTGAKWPLSGAVFRIGLPWGVSNRLSETRAEISIDEGLLLLVRVIRDSDS